MFQVAATCSHAWDNGATPYFPDFAANPSLGIPTNYEHVFFRCNHSEPTSSPALQWAQPIRLRFTYAPIPYYPNMRINGNFQNERFFAHHRDKIVKLFSPKEDDLAYINEKYKEILEHPKTVGIQVRNFGIPNDKSAWSWGAQYGYDYFQKAMALFPEDSLFIVSTNDMPFARQNVPTENKNVIFLENEHYYIELFLLSMLKHNIISNSTFGWWAAWLNRNPDKIVVTPRRWIGAKLRRIDVWPPGWIQINAKWGKPHGNPGRYR